MLNLGQMLGSGIFSVPGVILNSVGSVGMLLLFWVLAPVFCFGASFFQLLDALETDHLRVEAGLAVYSELASMFPDRSGAEVVYLEQAYPRPRFLVPVSFAVTTVLLSYVLNSLSAFIIPTHFRRFSATNSIVFAQYFMTIFDIPITACRQTYIGLAVITCAVAGRAALFRTALAH